MPFGSITAFKIGTPRELTTANCNFLKFLGEESRFVDLFYLIVTSLFSHAYDNPTLGNYSMKVNSLFVTQFLP